VNFGPELIGDVPDITDEGYTVHVSRLVNQSEKYLTAYLTPDIINLHRSTRGDRPIDISKMLSVGWLGKRFDDPVAQWIERQIADL
jgi:hypothetical protein